jgi:hypothetical protein
VNTVEILVAIESLEETDDRRVQALLRHVGVALHSALGPKFTMTTGGRTYRFDAKAHDGEHIGHDETLREVRP